MALLDNLNPQNLGLLSMSLLNNQNNGQSVGGLLMNAANAIKLLNNQQNNANADQYNPFPRIADTTQPQQPALNTSTQVPYQLPQDKQALLQTLKQNAAMAYPDNPNMQQVAISQAILESNLLNKSSGLAANNYNLFGIKGQGTAGSVNMPTQEFINGQMQSINDGFAKNNSVADSFMQHRNLMNRASRYKTVLSAQSPTEAFTALQQAGYATDPNYANKLNSVYSRYVAPLYQV